MEYLLRKRTIDSYNVSLCKQRLEKLIEEYIRVRYTFKNIVNDGDDYYIANMSYRFSDVPSAKISYNDRVSSSVCFKIDNENEAQRMQNDFDSFIKKLTDQEKDFFEIVLLERRAQRIVEDKYRITKTALEPIKQSCIIKACLHFDIAIPK